MLGNSEFENSAHEDDHEEGQPTDRHAEEHGDLSEQVSGEGNASNPQETDMEMFARYLDDTSDFDVPRRGDLRDGTIVERRSNELLVNIGVKRDGIVPHSDLSRLDPEYVKTLQVGDTVSVTVAKINEDDGSFILSMAEALQQKDWVEAERLLNSGEHTHHSVIGFNKGGITVEFKHLRGFVPASHLMNMPRNMSEEQRRAELEKRIGDELRLKVIEVERGRRRLVLSEMLAEREYRAQAKEQIFQQLKVGDVVEGEVRGIRPFGAFVDIGGADGLLHVSEIDWGPVAHPQNVLQRGDKLEVQVIRLDPEKQQIALSRKRLIANPWDGVESRYHVGDIVKVKITRVVDFGAFAQLEPGVEGLIHISELADISIAEPLKTVDVGMELDVKILRVDARRQRIGLSHRQAIGVLPVDRHEADEMETAAELISSYAGDEDDTDPVSDNDGAEDITMEIVDEIDGGEANVDSSATEE